MKKKKVAVLHAQVPFVRGGAENLVETFVQQLRYRDFDAELVSIPLNIKDSYALYDSYLMWRMAELSESDGEKIDMVIPLKVPTFAVKHENKVTWLMHQLRTAYDLRDNIMAGGYNTIPNGNQLIKKITELDNRFIKESKAVYAISKNVAARLKKYNGIDAKPLYHPPMLAGRYLSGEYEDYVLSVGRLNKMKRVDLLIRALPYCDRKIKVKIAGQGPELENLTHLARKLGVENRVDFLGFVSEEDLIKLYANALAVCFPPVDEDYGYITLEAFLSEKPIITCPDSGGVLEFVINGENGFVVESEGEEIGACFDKLFLDKSTAKSMGKNGYEKVKDISWDHVIDELTKTIR